MTVASMGALHRWHHENYAEAAREIWAAVGDIADVEIFGAQILTACYVRPIVTRGGIITMGTTQKEDVYQGVVSMVLKVGPAAFVNTDPADYGGKLPEPGDWVFSRVADAYQCSIKGTGGTVPAGRKDAQGREWDGWPCRLLYAADLYGRVKLPHVIV